MDASTHLCSVLSVQATPAESSDPNHHIFQVWSLEAKNMDTTRPTWMPAQVTVDASTDFRIVLSGQATNGGFAVDDITFSSGSCPSKYHFKNQLN